MKTRIRVVEDGFGRFYIPQVNRFYIWWDISIYSYETLSGAQEEIDIYWKALEPRKISYVKYP